MREGAGILVVVVVVEEVGIDFLRAFLYVFQVFRTFYFDDNDEPFNDDLYENDNIIMINHFKMLYTKNCCPNCICSFPKVDIIFGPRMPIDFCAFVH